MFKILKSKPQDGEAGKRRIEKLAANRNKRRETGLMEGIGTGDIDTGIEDIGSNIRELGSNIGAGWEAEEPAREWVAAAANLEAQAVGTTRSPQRATLSKRSLRPRTCGMFSYGSFHSRHAQSTPCVQPSTRREGCHPSAEDLELCAEAEWGYSWGMPRRWRRLMIAGGMVLLAIVVLWFTLQKGQPTVDFKLPDGTRMKLMEASHGKVLQFHIGLSWDKILSSFGPHPLARFHLYEMSFLSTNANGSLGIELRHFNPPTGVRFPANGLIKLTQVISPRNEVPGSRLRVNFIIWKVHGVNTVATEDIYWEFPISNEREIHFHLYYTDPVTRVETTNDFSIPNPAFK